MLDNRNFLIAIALSLAVLVGWQFFIAGPQMQKARQQQEIAAEQAAPDTANPASPGSAAGVSQGANAGATRTRPSP